jgi:hypothetical protein
VLIIDPATNATDWRTLRPSGGVGHKGIVNVPTVNKLFASPLIHPSILVVDPGANTTGYVGSWPEASNNRFWTIAYVPTVNKVYMAPQEYRPVVIVIDPMTNVTSELSFTPTTASSTLGYFTFVFSPATGKIYGIPSWTNDVVLIVDPVANTVNASYTLSALAGTRTSSMSDRWADGVYSPQTHKIYCPPLSPASLSTVLVVGATASSQLIWTSNTSCSDGTWSGLGLTWLIGSVVSIPSRIGGCDVYGYPSVPTNVRFDPSTTTVRFTDSPNLTDPTTPARFANWTLDLPQCITLDLADNAFTSLPPSMFIAFGGRVSVLDLSGGRALAAISPTALAGLTSLEDLRLSNIPSLGALPDGWLSGNSALSTVDLSRCGLRRLTNSAFAGAPALASIDLNSNPIDSVDTAPFFTHPLLTPTALVFTNTSILCVPEQASNGAVALVCLGCSTVDGNSLTVFRTDVGRRYCEQPTSIGGLVNATQYVPATAGTTAAQYLTWGARVRWAVNRAYRIQPVRYDAAQLTDGRILVGTVRFQVFNAPPGLFIDADTGEMLYYPLSTQPLRVSSVMVAHPEVPGVAVIANMSFEVLVEDVLNPNAIGPNGRGCANGGTPTDVYDGTSEFDLAYTCDCVATGFGGSNCETAAVTLVLPSVIGQHNESGIDDALDWGQRWMWALERSYFLRPADVRNASLSTGEPVDVSLLRYSIRPAPSGLLIDSASGFAQLTPRAVGNTTALVYASLDGYPEVEIGRVVFDVRVDDINNPNATGPNNRGCANNGTKTDVYDGVSEFDLMYACECVGEFIGANCEDRLESLRLHVLSLGQYIPPQSSLSFEALGVAEDDSAPTYARYSRTMWALEQRYRIAPVNITRAVLSRTAQFNWSETSAADVSNDVVPTFQLDPLPRGFFIDSTTGELIGQPEALGTTLSTLYAQHAGAERAAVANINFTVLHQDTAVSSYGPNSKDCSNAAQRVDTVPFDQAFVCDCALTSTTTTGDNCEQELVAAASTASNSATSTPLYAAVGAIVVLAVAVVTLLRYRRYKVEHSPINLSAMQDGILSSLGIGTTFDIGPHEFGVTLTLPDLRDLPHVTAQRVNDAVRETLRIMIDMSSRAFRTTPTGPKRNALMSIARLSMGAARVNVEASKNRVLVVFARPESAKDGVEEDVVAGLQMAADRGQFTVGNGWVVTEVSVAVPRCIPREVDRSTIVRLNPLGEGNFAEVVKVRLRLWQAYFS